MLPKEVIEAYVYCAYKALPLWMCMQVVMRQNHEKLGITLPYPHGDLQPSPTTRRLRQILQPIQILHWQDAAGMVHRQCSELSLKQRQVLLMLGMNSCRLTQIPSG